MWALIILFNCYTTCVFYFPQPFFSDITNPLSLPIPYVFSSSPLYFRNILCFHTTTRSSPPLTSPNYHIQHTYLNNLLHARHPPRPGRCPGRNTRTKPRHRPKHRNCLPLHPRLVVCRTSCRKVSLRAAGVAIYCICCGGVS
jgi:hypothetical protein